MDDVESNRYGHELARLLKAKEVAKSGYDLARRNYVAKPVLEDVKVCCPCSRSIEFIMLISLVVRHGHYQYEHHPRRKGQ